MLETIKEKDETFVDDQDLDMDKEVDGFGTGIVDKIVTLEDDASLPILTWRFILISTIMAIFGGLLAQIYVFKPQPVSVSQLFLLIIVFSMGHFFTAIGLLLSKAFAPESRMAKILYPGPFSIKEHVAIVIVCSTAGGSALATELLATLDLFYNKPLPAHLAILLVYSSQMLGYGFAGLYRRVLVYEKVTFFPSTMATVSLFTSLHTVKDSIAKHRMKIFWTLFGIMFIWAWFPQYIAPALTGISIICLLNQKSTSFTRLFGPESYNKSGYGMFTNIFGGTTNNEGLGMFALCFDWNLITNLPLTYPWATQVNIMIGTGLCCIIVPLMYITDTWSAQSFPFLAQDLFKSDGSSYDQLAILNNVTLVLDEQAYEDYGPPFFATSWAFGLLTSNLAITAAMTHILLFHFDTLRLAYKTIFTDKQKSDNPYQIIMEKYDEVPQWWYLIILVLSITGGLFVITITDAGLPLYGFVLAIAMGAILTFVVGFVNSTTGYSLDITNLIQMTGGLLHPGVPVANMYFTLYGSNSVKQAVSMLVDLKLGQYLKIPPRVLFISQIYGTFIGGICNYVMTTSIVSNNRETLLDPQGSYQWSGYLVQNFNSLAITWGALPYKLYGPGQTYFLVALALPLGFFLPIPFYLLHRQFPIFGFNYINMGVLTPFLAYLTVGVNSSILTTFTLGFLSQYWLRKYRPEWFNKYNYIVSAGLDAGTQISVFIINLAVLGAANTLPFPKWALNPTGNPDFCPSQPE